MTYYQNPDAPWGIPETPWPAYGPPGTQGNFDGPRPYMPPLLLDKNNNPYSSSAKVSPIAPTTPVPNAPSWGIPETPWPAYGPPGTQGNIDGPRIAAPAMPTSPSPSAVYAHLRHAGNMANPTGGVPMPPRRPANFPMDAAPAAAPFAGSPQAYGYPNNPPMGDHGGMSGASYDPPPGSNLSQGPGKPGQGVSHFLSNLFGGGSQGSSTSSPSVSQGDPQSGMPSFMKGSTVANLLQLLGKGGGFGGGSSAPSDGFGGSGGLLSGLF